MALPEPETAPLLGASPPAAPGSAQLEDDASPEDDQPAADDDDSGLAPGTPIADGPFVPPLPAPAPAPSPAPAVDDAGGEAPDPDDEAELPEDLGGGSRRSRRTEALQLSHKLTHLPKNPFCQACQEAKMKQYYSKGGAFTRELDKWAPL